METATRLRAAVVADPYSGEASDLDWDAASSETIPLLAFAPGGSTEIVSDWRLTADTKPTAYVPTGSDVRSQDRLVIRGLTYEVDGVPADWRHPAGLRPGLAVTLTRLGA